MWIMLRALPQLNPSLPYRSEISGGTAFVVLEDSEARALNLDRFVMLVKY